MAASGPSSPEDRLFAALGDPTRRFLIERLASGGDASATALATELPISRQAVAKHLELLREAALVTSDRAGRETRYRLEVGRLTEVRAWVERIGSQWDRRLARLEGLLAGDPPA